jgi:hypothetical protein
MLAGSYGKARAHKMRNIIPVIGTNPPIEDVHMLGRMGFTQALFTGAQISHRKRRTESLPLACYLATSHSRIHLVIFS